MIKRLSKFILILILITGWMFGGFPGIPPRIEKAYALNQLANPDFDSDASSWTTSTDTSTSDTCGATGTAATAGMGTFAYYGADGNPAGSFRARSSTGNNARYKSYIYQSITVPGSGTVKIQSKFDYSATSTAWRASNVDGHIKLKLYNSSNTTFLANMACVQLPGSNVSWTTVASSTAYSATGGTTYVVRATIAYRNSGTTLANILIDNIVLTAAPTGLTASAPAATSNAQLDWTASAAGSGAAGLHGTGPYQVYKKTSSPVGVSDILATSTSNSYTDTATTGNTTYYYAIRNYDSNNIPSPLSAEASVLTRPGAPTSLNFTSVTATTLRLNWTAPNGGATSYKIERCQGSGCTGFSEIASGVTTAYYDDSSLTCNTLYRYQVRATNASGDGAYSSIAEQTTSTCVASLTFVVSTNTFPTITPGSPIFATTTLSVDTDNSTGWNVTVSRDDTDTTMDLDSDATTNITDQTAWSPGAATTTAGNAVRISSLDSSGDVLAMRVMTASGTPSFISTAWWGATDAYIDSATTLWAGFNSTTKKIGDSSASSGGSAKLNTVLYYLDVPPTQKTGAYSGGITYTATMNP